MLETSQPTDKFYTAKICPSDQVLQSYISSQKMNKNDFVCLFTKQEQKLLDYLFCLPGNFSLCQQVFKKCSCTEPKGTWGICFLLHSLTIVVALPLNTFCVPSQKYFITVLPAGLLTNSHAHHYTGGGDFSSALK